MRSNSTIKSLVFFRALTSEVVPKSKTQRIAQPRKEGAILISKKRRHHSPDLKARVGLGVLKGVEPVHAIAAR